VLGTGTYRYLIKKFENDKILNTWAILYGYGSSLSLPLHENLQISVYVCWLFVSTTGNPIWYCGEPSLFIAKKEATKGPQSGSSPDKSDKISALNS
jgi:hypothetical protein